MNAHDGSIVWRYDAMNHGSGQSLYSGRVSFPSTYYSSPNFQDNVCGGIWIGTGYFLIDSGSYGGYLTTDMQGNASDWLGYSLSNYNDNQWGIALRCPALAQREQAAVDAHFGYMQTWNLMLNWLGRRGINGAGYQMYSRVHYGSGISNAAWNGRNIWYGDGNGFNSFPFVAVDIVGHETGHGVADSILDGSPGVGPSSGFSSHQGQAMGESFSDILGTMVEYYTNIRPDYLIGEDCLVGAIRDMANPPSKGDPDHFLNYNPGQDVHNSAGVQNKAFFLLAEGGTHPFSRVTVAGIGRNPAVRIFHRALNYLRPDSGFYNNRQATLQAAADLYGSGHFTQTWTGRA